MGAHATPRHIVPQPVAQLVERVGLDRVMPDFLVDDHRRRRAGLRGKQGKAAQAGGQHDSRDSEATAAIRRSEEHTSELQSLMRISYAVLCFKKKTIYNTCPSNISTTSN